MHPDFWPIWRDIVGAAHPEPIDRLFAGEAYGQRLAAEVGAAEFILVGPRVFPTCPGTAIRADPWAHWEALPAPVRPHYRAQDLPARPGEHRQVGAGAEARARISTRSGCPNMAESIARSMGWSSTPPASP